MFGIIFSLEQSKARIAEERRRYLFNIERERKRRLAAMPRYWGQTSIPKVTK